MRSNRNNPWPASTSSAFPCPTRRSTPTRLNILDLAGIPVKSADRDDSHPIIIAGGHSTLNPEPMHAFIDAFVIGEGEEVIHDIIDTVMSLRGRALRSARSNLPANEEIATHPSGARNDILKALAHIPGVYVPIFYEPHYLDDGTLSHIEALLDDIANPVVKRMVAKLPPPPTKFIVPNIGVVHNRASVEIMRGCTRGCRFCHAGMITRPVREEAWTRSSRRLCAPWKIPVSKNWRSCRCRHPIFRTSSS